VKAKLKEPNFNKVSLNVEKENPETEISKHPIPYKIIHIDDPLISITKTILTESFGNCKISEEDEKILINEANKERITSWYDLGDYVQSLFLKKNWE